MTARWIAVAAMVASLGMRAQTPVIRVESREVLVDVTVTGKKGAVPSGLGANDFNIWEDGKRQKIISFSSASTDPESTEKHFVLYFDDSTMNARHDAATFVAGLASPDRYMAVVAFNGFESRVQQNFTTSASALRKAVETRLPREMALGRNLISGQANQSGERMGSESMNPVMRLAESLKAVAKSVAPASGRKALLLFTGGYALDEFSTGAVDQVITECNRANVAVYAIGNRTGGAVGEFSTRLANGTGGALVAVSRGSDDLPDQLAAIAREQDDYYRVGYIPPAAKTGSCHELRVQVDSKDAEVGARKQYCTTKPVDLVAGRIAGQGLETKTARADAGENKLSAGMETPWFYTGRNRASVHLSLEVIPAGLKLEKGNGKWHGEMDLVGIASREDGVTAARFVDTVSLDAENQQQADELAHTPYRYENQFPVGAGSYTFRLAIGVSGNTAGSVAAPLEVPPWNPSQFGIGSIALSRETKPVSDSASQGGPILEGRTPLVAAGREFVPAAKSGFRWDEHVYFYTEVYEPTLESAEPAVVTMEYRVRDRKTGELKKDTGMVGIANYVRAGNPVVPFATALPVAELPPGSYRLEVRAGHSSGADVVARSVDFDVN